MSFKTKHVTLEGMPVFAKELKSLFKKPQVLLLKGPMGVGKTTLTRFLVEGDEVASYSKESRTGKNDFSDQVSSPSFAVQQSYITSSGPVLHVDLYRLKDDDDLESTGFWDIFSQPEENYLIIIEWADRLNPDFLPPGWNYLTVLLFFGKNPKSRKITISDNNPEL